MAFALAGCTAHPAEPSFIGHASKGATIEKMQVDGAQCRSQARLTASDQYDVYREAYSNCMLGKASEA
jgi:hypothetical protein